MNTCLLCNNKTGVSVLSPAIEIFGEHNNFPSDRSLSEIISEIIDKPVDKDNVHTDIICKKCHKSCTEYDTIRSRLQQMKDKIKAQFKEALPNTNLTYDNYTEDVEKIKATSPEKTISLKKLVLPASKLQPLPPNYMLKVGNLPVATRTITTSGNVITPFLSIKKVENTINKETDSEVYVTDDFQQITGDKKEIQNNLLSFNINNIPKDLPSILIAKGDDVGRSLIKLNNEETSAKGDEENGADMEIDEVFALSVVPMTTESGELVLEVEGLKNEKDAEVEEYLDMSVLEEVEESAGDDNFILRKLRILNDPGGGSSQAEDGEDDGHSNDGSQIEIQVSGDEETANAIITAAKEQGGAFIKVESGEMFRVKSVESKIEEDTKKGAEALLPMVEQVGSLFKCLLCQRNKDGLLGGTTEDKEKGNAFMGNADATMRHLKSEHDARTYICQFCNAIMRKRTEYTLHFAEHAQSIKGTKPYWNQCEVCYKTFGSRVLLEDHMNTHRGERPHVCDICKKTFASKYTLQTHYKTHMDRPRPHACKQCGKAFLSTQNLAQHMKTHSGVKDFVCNVCQKAFSTQHNLEVHTVVHSNSKPYVCSVCKKGFARRAECRDHMRIHTGERPYECDICGARFAQNSNLHSHKRARHLDDRRYHCEHCPKKFKRKRLLEYHIKASHTGERPLLCKICGATFVYPEHFKKHTRIHNGEKPYNCEICGKSFNSPDNRNMHRFVHSDKKLYECFTCGAGFMRKNQLYMHMNASGHLAESIVVNQPRVTKMDTNTATHYIEENDGQSRSENEVSATIYESGPEIIFDSNQDNSEEPSEMIAKDENGQAVRLIQIKLSYGNNGWVAVND